MLETSQMPKDFEIPSLIQETCVTNAKLAAWVGTRLAPRKFIATPCYQEIDYDQKSLASRLVLERPDNHSSMRRLVSEIDGRRPMSLEMPWTEMSLLMAYFLPQDPVKNIVYGRRVFPNDSMICFTYRNQGGIGIQPVIQRPSGLQIPRPIVLTQAEIPLLRNKLQLHLN